MLDNYVEDIAQIFEPILGESRRGVRCDGWTEYNCPNCADIDGVDCDWKYNLNINYKKGVFHCWKCEYHGRLSKILKNYGSTSLYSEYRSLIKSIGESELYNMHFGNANGDEKEDEVIVLPQNCLKIEECNPSTTSAYKYLKRRGIGNKIIEKFNLLCTSCYNKDWRIRNRIIIPSYDKFGEINYWVGRDYSGKSNVKYKNSENEKTKIIFNEKLVNWYEPVTLVEGPFDHIVVPNSIPLLGKKLSEDNAVYKGIMENLESDLYIFLDDDAIKDAIKIYKLLNTGKLRGRVKVIIPPDGYDASLIFQEKGKDGILEVMRNATSINEYNLLYV